MDPLYRSPRPAARRQVSPLAFCSSVDSRLVEGLVEDGWPDLVRFFLGDGGRRRRCQIQELEELGRGPGRWVTSVGFFFYDSDQSQGAMELLQFMVFISFSDGGVRRRGGRRMAIRVGSWGFVVFSILFRVPRVVWLYQPTLYPLHAFLYLYNSLLK